MIFTRLGGEGGLFIMIGKKSKVGVIIKRVGEIIYSINDYPKVIILSRDNVIHLFLYKKSRSIAPAFPISSKRELS